MKECAFDEEGQSTVEVALLIPLLAIFLMLIIQVGLVARQHVLVSNASRTGAREASVNKDTSEAIFQVRKTLPGAKVEIHRPSSPGQYLKVTVTDTVESSLPIVGVFFPNVTVRGETSMRVEK